MEGTSDQPANKTIRFFKLMMPGRFEQQLNLPPKFCKKMKDDKSRVAVLKGCKGRLSVSVSRTGGLITSFKHGWPQFVAENRLGAGDCVVFEQTRRLHFNVSVFDASSMEQRHFLEHPTNHYQHCCRIPCFTVQMGPFTARKFAKVGISAELVRKYDLQKKTSVTLRDERERSWPIQLQLQQKLSAVYMRKGWHEFHQSNELQVGDVCRFELDTDSVLTSSPFFHVYIDRAAAART